MPDVLYRECGKPAEIRVVDETVRLAEGELNAVLTLLSPIPVHKQVAYIERLRKRAATLSGALYGARTTEMDCLFAGDVEAQRSGPPGDVKLTWTCPLCGHEHEEVD